MAKTLIYQIFTRLFSNTNTSRSFDGTIEQNGTGKFNDINDAALDRIASMGFTHVWYTGVIRHASTTDYPFITHKANANVVKGRAGSPYAICDYYDVDPDLACDVAHRMDEFKALIERTHKHGLKVIIDFVPNHVARNYHSNVRPAPQIGGSDDCSVAFSPLNNFYYLPGQKFQSPVNDRDKEYVEEPAKVSGNDAFTASPSVNDWYETVKLNYGVDIMNGRRNCFSPQPDTWYKMRDILHYWAEMNIDGFRVDMAEMVPVEFWHWCIAQITMRHPKIIFIAETYDLNQYRNYIGAGFNYLYDKVNFYDTVRSVICGQAPANIIGDIWRRTEGIGQRMLYFLENHDEQRIASDYFAGDPFKALPGVVLTMTMGKGGAMTYFGQELGERGMDHEGFSGVDGRTTIFDYWGIERVQQMVNDHKYDGAKLPEDAKRLDAFYQKIGRLVHDHDAFATGEMYDLMWNQHISVDATKIYAYLRYDAKKRYMIVCNFSDDVVTTSIKIGDDAWKLMGATWNECIVPYDVINERALSASRASIDVIKTTGLPVEVEPHNVLIVRL
ncbi:MAG: alpha-amylase family protein [Bacteroidales bacterium]|nr:alpha-amylase family protein [Bacteroidales bacterium]